MAYTFTDVNAKEAIASGKPIVIDFWATWCAPCMRLAPTIEELAEEYADRVVIGKYNVDDNTDLGAEYLFGRFDYRERRQPPPLASDSGVLRVLGAAPHRAQAHTA